MQTVGTHLCHGAEASFGRRVARLARFAHAAPSSARQPASRRPCVAVRANDVRARWCIDVQYGHKQTVTGLLQEWVADVGSKAGLTHSNTRLSSGSVGVAESRLELEVTFASLSEWERFLATIPAKEHRAWSQRVQAMIVSGSPRWELYRAVGAFPDGQEPAAAAAPAARPVLALPTGFSLAPQVPDAQSASTSGGYLITPSGSSSDDSGSSSNSGLSFIDNAQDAEVILDWKGDPLKINPGDKLPFKFL